MKTKLIPTDDLGLVSYYLLQITQGIFRLNDELFFCPFVQFNEKDKPFRLRTWQQALQEGESVPLHLNSDTLLLFADPVHPSSYLRTKQKKMDVTITIDRETVIRKKGSTLFMKRQGNKNVLTFVRKITDKERFTIFDPKDDHKHWLRLKIFDIAKKSYISKNEYDQLGRLINKLHESV